MTSSHLKKLYIVIDSQRKHVYHFRQLSVCWWTSTIRCWDMSRQSDDQVWVDLTLTHKMAWKLQKPFLMKFYFKFAQIHGTKCICKWCPFCSLHNVKHYTWKVRWMLISVPWHDYILAYIDGLAQNCSNSIANALELLQSFAKPSIWCKEINLKVCGVMDTSNWKLFNIILLFLQVSWLSILLMCGAKLLHWEIKPVCK